MNLIPVSNDLHLGQRYSDLYYGEVRHTTEKASWIYVFVLTSLVLRTSIMTAVRPAGIAPKWVWAEATDWESTLESIRGCVWVLGLK